VNKAILLFLLLFLWGMNNVAWAGEYLDQGCEYMQIKHQYDEAEKYLTLAIENGDNAGGIALLYRARNYESGLKNYKAAIDDYTNFLENWGGVNSSIAIVG
jgi:tetratricopeptide (TPR) repeat protein